MFPIFLSAIAPGLALLTYFYLKDKYSTEPILLVLRMFILGALIVIPVMIIQHGMATEVSNHSIFMSFVVAGLLEEFFKWFLLYFLVYNHVEFDEPYDGVVYSVAVSLGFASLENFFYILVNGMSVAWIRALGPVSSHALFGVIMGYYLGKAKFGKANAKPKKIFSSLLVPVLLHGLYDFLIQASQLYWVWTIVPFMVGLWWIALHQVKKANDHSKFLFDRTNYTGNETIDR